MMCETRLPKPETKEMLSVSQRPDGKLKVRINYSSMELINTCMRKSHYLLDRNLRTKSESPALLFGSAIHRGLEAWYLSPLEERVLPVGAKEKAQLKVLSGTFEGEEDFPAFARMLSAFALSKDSLAPDGDKRSPENGAWILSEYCRRYKDDGLTVIAGPDGEPVVEKRVSFKLWEDSEHEIEYFGSMDVALENKDLGTQMIVDHKTTTALGSQFYNRIKPNHQYTGYVWGARESLGIDTNLFMVNGIQVAKTMHQFARQVTERTEEDFEELRLSVMHAVSIYLDSQEHKFWPQNAPNPCTMYGGCSFLKVCEVPSSLKENVISSLWDEA